MNPNKPLISDEEMLLKDKMIESILDGYILKMIGSSSERYHSIEIIKEQPEYEATLDAMKDVRVFYESHLSTLTTENRTLKFDLQARMEQNILLTEHYKIQLLKNRELSEKNQQLIDLLKEIDSRTEGIPDDLYNQITSFLKENQL